MIITGVETLRLEEFANLLWVIVETDEGAVGLGETFFGPQAVESYIHETAAPLIIGEDPTRVEHLNRKLQSYVGFRGSGAETRGASAVDLACWDIWGKATGQSLTQLLGGASRDKLRTYNTCAGYRYIRSNRGQRSDNWGLGGCDGPYEDLDAFMERPAELAESLLEQGITAMKIWPLDPFAEATGGSYISGPDLKKGLEPFADIRRAVGDKMDIMLECHGLWDLPAAVRIANAAREFDLFWIEDPIRADSVSALGEFRSKSTPRVCGSETIAGLWGVKDLIEAGAIDVLKLDLGWIGGLTQARKAAPLAEAHHLPVAPHDCTGPVIYTASTHLSMATPNALIQESVRAFYTGWYTEVATALPLVENGFVRSPDGPGLGMNLLPDIRQRKDSVVRRSTAKDV